MQSAFQPFHVREPNQDLQHSAFFIEVVCLVLAAQIIVVNLLSRVFAPVERLLPAGLLSMQVSSACAGLCAIAALFLTEASRSKQLHRLGRISSMGTAIVAFSALWMDSSHSGSLLHPGQMALVSGSLLAAPAAFLSLGIVILLIEVRDSFWSLIADSMACGLAFMVLVLFFEFLFGLARLPGSSIAGPVELPTLACLALLTLAAVLRRAGHGIFSVFLASGIDGQIARILAPILLCLPFLRELGRARLLNAHLIPARYATAVLTAAATAVAFALLLVLSRVINRMQTEIQQLNLRDELTGLYNFRGFNLFAEQAYRLARRSGQPFGVLFADMDNLKLINDELGHNAGSLCIVETSKLLSATFRDTDVIGRLGGDEFVVAGQFGVDEIASAMARLRSAASTSKEIAGKRIALSLSLGYASTEHGSEDTLKTVLARADKKMYMEKREKKRAAGPIAN